MPRRIFAVGRSRLVAAAVGIALLSLAAAPAKAGCSMGVTLYNAYWCPYCKQVRAILARNHIRYTIQDATTARNEEVDEIAPDKTGAAKHKHVGVAHERRRWADAAVY